MPSRSTTRESSRRADSLERSRRQSNKRGDSQSGLRDPSQSSTLRSQREVSNSTASSATSAVGDSDEEVLVVEGQSLVAYSIHHPAVAASEAAWRRDRDALTDDPRFDLHKVFQKVKNGDCEGEGADLRLIREILVSDDDFLSVITLTAKWICSGARDSIARSSGNEFKRSLAQRLLNKWRPVETGEKNFAGSKRPVLVPKLWSMWYDISTCMMDVDGKGVVKADAEYNDWQFEP